MDFGEALKALKEGKKVARAGWNGKDMWVALTPGSLIPTSMVKLHHAAGHRADELIGKFDHPGEIKLLPHIDMRVADGSMVIGWLASQTDLLAEDWEVLD